MNINTKYHWLIRSAIWNVRWWYYAWADIRDEVWLSKNKLNLFADYLDQFREIHYKTFPLTQRQLKVAIKAIEINLRECGIEEFATITGIDFEDGVRMLQELREIEKEWSEEKIAGS